MLDRGRLKGDIFGRDPLIPPERLLAVTVSQRAG